MSSIAERLKARAAASEGERKVAVYGSRDGWPVAGSSAISPNRYLLRIKEGTIFKTKDKGESYKVVAEVVAVLANGFKEGMTFGEKVSYGPPNKAGERVALMAGKPVSDDMVVKDIKGIVAAMQGVDPSKLPANALAYLIDDGTAALVMQAFSDGDTEGLSAFPAYSYAVLLKSGAADLVDPTAAGVDDDDIIAAAREVGVLPQKRDRKVEAAFLAEVVDQCKCIPLELNYADRLTNDLVICESFVQQNKAKTAYYCKQVYKPASESTVSAALSAEELKAYKAYRACQ